MRDLVDVYRSLAARCDYPLHLGLTEAGMAMKGIVASTAGLSLLLTKGIGDTIRVSLTPAPGGDRTEEVLVAQQVLQSLGLRSFTPQVSACPGLRPHHLDVLPGDGRADPGLPARADADWAAQYPGVEDMRVAVMGCVVNGPGESKHADIGISLPGTFEEPVAPVFVDGALRTTLRGEGLVKEFMTHPRRLRREPLWRGRRSRLTHLCLLTDELEKLALSIDALELMVAERLETQGGVGLPEVTASRQKRQPDMPRPRP